MVDRRLIQQLDNPDPEVRKKVIKALAKSQDPSAIKYLATLYKTDSDPEVRELALKAGKYIRKVAGDDIGSDSGRSMSFTSPLDTAEDEDSVYPQDDASAPPRPEDIEVPEADAQRARSYLEQALDLQVRGEDERAVQFIARAFRLNPKFQFDGYALGVAATVMNRGRDEVLTFLKPEIEAGLKNLTKKSTTQQRSTPQLVAALLMLIGVLLAVGAYFSMDWFDIGAFGMVDEFGNETTLRAAFDQLRQEADQQLNDPAFAELPPEFRAPLEELINSVLNFKLGYSGWDVARLSTGVGDPLEIMGLGGFMDALQASLGDLGGEFEIETETELPPAEPLDYTLLVMPVVLVILGVLAMLLLRN
ncbi:MAG: HEAT repeat domain-containing protein, partial [Chloroflexi bacterium]